MALEIEIKVRVDSLDGIRNNLLKNGCVLVADQDEHDTYFNAPHRDFAVTDEALRLRCLKNQKCGEITVPNLTYKGKKVGAEGFKAREEIIADVYDADNIATILEKLGFVKTAEVVKHREIYRCQDAIVTLDDLYGVGYFSEIEAAAHLSEKDAIETIEKIAEMAGISGERLTESYLEIMMREKK